MTCASFSVLLRQNSLRASSLGVAHALSELQLLRDSAFRKKAAAAELNFSESDMSDTDEVNKDLPVCRKLRKLDSTADHHFAICLADVLFPQEGYMFGFESQLLPKTCPSMASS